MTCCFQLDSETCQAEGTFLASFVASFYCHSAMEDISSWLAGMAAERDFGAKSVGAFHVASATGCRADDKPLLESDSTELLAQIKDAEAKVRSQPATECHKAKDTASARRTLIMAMATRAEPAKKKPSHHETTTSKDKEEKQKGTAKPQAEAPAQPKAKAKAESKGKATSKPKGKTKDAKPSDEVDEDKNTQENPNTESAESPEKVKPGNVMALRTTFIRQFKEDATKEDHEHHKTDARTLQTLASKAWLESSARRKALEGYSESELKRRRFMPTEATEPNDSTDK